MTRMKLFVHRKLRQMVFALNHNKSLRIYFFCVKRQAVKRQAKNDFLKDVESTVSHG